MKISTFFKPLSFLPALMLMYMIYSFSGETGEGREALLQRLGSIVSEKLSSPKENEPEPLTDP